MSVPVAQAGGTAALINSSNAWVCSMPAGVVAGDLVVAFLSHQNPESWSAAGWTPGPTFSSPLAGAVGCIMSMWRICDGTEGATVTFGAGSFHTGIYFMVRVTGADQTSPIEASGAGASAAAFTANPTTIGSITTDVADCLLMTCWYIQATADVDMTPLSGSPSKIINFFPGGSSSYEGEVWAGSFAGPGATGTQDWNISSTSKLRTALKLAIKPAAAGGGGTTGQTFPHGKKGASPTTGQLFPRRT